MFDEDDDSLDQDFGDVTTSDATDFSSQSRRESKPDFSAFGEKVDAPPAAAARPRASGAKLDFSSFGEKATVPTSPPLPRARPSVVDQNAEPQDAPPQPSTAAEVPLPRPRPKIDFPAGPDYVAPLEDAPFRTGGTAIDAAFGTNTGMLTGEEAHAERAQRLAAAEQALEQAKAERVQAEYRFTNTDNARDQAEPVRVDTRLVRRALTQAQRREAEAATALQAIKTAPLPTQGSLRNIGESVIGTGAQMGADALTGARGLSELLPNPVDLLDPKAAKESRAEIRKFTENADAAAKRVGHADPARAEDFSTQMASGATSMGMFMAGGLGARALGASAALGSGGIGAIQMGGQQFAEAETALKVLERRIAATKEQGLDVSPLEGQRDTLLKTKYVALFAGMGLGATEAIPVERFFNRLNEVSKGRVGAIIANSAKQSAEEMLQEIGQQIGSNVVARVLYDEGRDIFKDVNQSAAVAMVLGGVMGAGAGAVQPVNRRTDAQAGIPAMPAPGTSPIEDIFRKAGETIGATQPSAPTSPVASAAAPAGSPQATETPDISGDGQQASPNVSAIERRVLRKKGWAEEDIDSMSRAEAEAELGEAAQQGVEAGTEEQPSAEPVGDIAAQIGDLQSGKRDGVWLPKATVDHLTKTLDDAGFDALLNAGTVINNFDGEGGLLIARDMDVARKARKDKTSGVDMQEIIGGLTGDGQGKPAGADTVVQQQDQRGNVTRERLVSDDEVAPVAQDFAEPGRTVEVKPGTDALAERASRVDEEANQAMVGLSEMFGAAPEQQIAPTDNKVSDQAPDFSEHGTPVKGDGTKTDPVKVHDPLDIERAAEQVADNPTPGQKEAENYKMGHIKWPGLGRTISIETKKGGVRTAKDKSWSVPNYPANYGRIKGTKGADGQQIDAFVGDDITVPHGFILDQYDPKTGKFDEHKTFFGIRDQAEVERIYDAAFNDGSGPSRRLTISQVPMKVMKVWATGGIKRKAFAKKPDAAPDATAAVNAALEAAGIPASAVDPADVQAAANVVEETGAAPGDAFQQVMAEQIEGQADAEPGAVSESVEGVPQGGPAEESQQLLGRGEVLEDQAGGGVRAGQAGAPDFSAQGEKVNLDQTGNAAEARDERSGDTEKAEDAGVAEPKKVKWFGTQEKAQAYIDKKKVGTTHEVVKADRRFEIREKQQPAEQSAETNRRATLATKFADHLREGESFGNILQARKMAREAGFDGDAKAVEEAMELAVVTLAREIAADRTDPKANFTALVDLYSRQPKLGTRTSTSMREQAFSTPVPLAYMASRLAGITPESVVYEPTAGNGALLIEAAPKNAVANEINPDRADNLKSQGFDVTTDDAAKVSDRPSAYDVVIANPPFGALKDENGQSKGYNLTEIQSGYRTNEIDHVIALRSLKAMKDSGRAVLLVGGLNKLNSTGAGRSDAYNGKAKREFYKTLYDRYNVTDHFTTAGELWERQGAGWPVDVIVIEGRGKSSRKLPAVDVPRVLTSWDQLGGLLNGLPERSGQEAGAASDGSAGRGAPDRNGRVRGDGERVSELGTAPGQPGDVQPGSVERAPSADREGQQSAGDERGDAGRVGVEPDAERRPPGLKDDFDDIFDNALDQTFGPQAGPKSSPAPATPADTRTTAQVANSAAKNVAGSADAAMSGLVQLFGGGKTIGSGLGFDLETYAKAKPLFVQAAAKFGAFKDDIAELVKRMVGEMQWAYGLTRDGLEKMRPYLRKFMEEVKAGVVSLAPAAAEKPAAPATAKEQETATQVAYAPQSKVGYGLGTLVPVNMRVSISESLAALEKRVGSIDDYVAKQLGYSTNELPAYFAQEQIDALAGAIDNLERGKGYIIGDQTGIGKGRVNAAIIRWAINSKRVPVFVTEKPNLYSDMYRDLSDTGIQSFLGDREPRILETNALDKDLPLGDDGKVVLTSTSTTQKAAMMTEALNGEFSAKYDVVFTTYNQMQTVKGSDTARRAFLERLAPNAVVIFDESHNAGGQGKTAPKKGVTSNRSGFARDLVEKASGVFYSSATYAKRPDVMDLYSKTDMVMAVEKKEDLAEAIARGGVPMQQVVAAMLAKAGQYIRRERSFAGVTYDTPIINVDHAQYDDISQALALIQNFSVEVERASKNMDAEIKAEAQKVSSDNSTGGAGASSVLFTSIMHNIINQMLLALKAGPVAKMAIEAVGRGEKPVITLANTMESFLSDYAETVGIKTGDVLDADFSRVLVKYLDRTRTLIIKKPFSKEPGTRKYLTDQELGSHGLSIYNRAKAHIESLVLTDLAVSPIDRIKQDLADAGLNVGEITGRGTIIDYSGDEPILRNRPGKETSISGRLNTIKRFNNGELDVVILNQSGATGLSLHASKTFKDQRQRHMMIAQAEANIDTHMQMLGRVHRTGQVIVPKYSQLVADIPAEKRPAAVLAKKMASLNANTTASRGGALTAKDVPDFINEYGDQVAAVIIADDYDLYKRLGSPGKMIDAETGKVTVEDAIRKITGRIPLLPLKEQEELYERLEADYASLLEQKAAMGENALEAQTLDLKARPVERTEVVKRKSSSNSPFAMPVHVEKTSIVRQGKPFSPMELMNRIAEQLGGTGQMEQHVKPEDASGNAAKMLADLNDQYGQSWGPLAIEKEATARTDALAEFSTFQREQLDGIDKEKPEQIEKERLKFNAVKDRWATLHQMLRIGQRITLKTASGNFTSIVLKIEQTGKTRNPLALSSWKATFALASAERQVTLPFSRLYEDQKSPSDEASAIEVRSIGWHETPEQTIRLFAGMQSGSREERYIATGNLLAAYDWLSMKGRIINYTDEQGHIRQGILTAKDFDLKEHFGKKARPIRDPAEVAAWIKNHEHQIMWSEDQVVRLTITYGRLHVSTEAAKRTGGVFFLDNGLTDLVGDFYKKGPVMTTDLPVPADSKLTQIVERFQKLGAVFVDREQQGPPPTEKIEQPKGDDDTKSRAGSLTPAAERSRGDLQAAVLRAVEQVAGREVAQRTATPDQISGALGKDWNAATNDTGPVGSYSPRAERENLFPLIAVALADPDAVQTAYHEAWHAIEGTLAPEEIALLRRETPRLREFVSRRLPKIADLIQNAEAEEIWAEAAAIYANTRTNGEPVGGIHIAVRRIFEKIMRLLAQIRNAVNGMGFRSAESIFADFARGDMAVRRGALPTDMRNRWWAQQQDQGEATSARRRPAVPGDVIPPPESVARAWEASYGKPWSERISDAVDALLLTPARSIWDRQIDLLRFQKAAEAMSGPVPESLDTYLAASLYPGKVGERMKDAIKDLWEPVYDAMRDHKVGRDELHEYLYARHAPERNAAIREIDPANDAGSGMSDDEAAEIMGGIIDRQTDFEAVAKLIDKVIAANRSVMLREGLESERTLDAWTEKYSHYVPLKGWESGSEDELAMPSPSAGQGYSVRGPETQRALGRFDRADDILANLLDQTQRTIIRAEKNKVAKTFLRFARENSSPFYKIGLLETRRRINPLTGMVETYVVNASPNRDEVFAAKVGGKTYFIEIRHEGLLQALKTLGAEKMNAFMGLMWRLTREYSRFQTAKNPEFVFTNLARDIQDAGFTITAEQRERYTRRFIANIANGRALFGAILGTIDKGAHRQARIWFEEWREAGGKISHYGLKDIEGLQKEIQRELNQRTESTAKTVAMAAPRFISPINGKLVKFLEALSDVTESMTRLAVYISAREIGMTKAQAARMSRNATVDFNRRGIHGTAISALYAFANANIQGNVRLLRTLRKSSTARRMATGLIVAGMLMTYWNAVVSPEDDDKKSAYEKRKYWERERNIIIYLPGSDKAAKIPLGYGLNVFWMMGENLAMRMLGKISTTEAIGNVLSTTVSAFNPLGSEGSWFDAKTWVRAYTPTVVRFLPELGFNRNWADNPIHPDPMPWTRHLPHSDRHKALTHPAAVNVAEFLNRLTGGNKFEPGFVSLYPDDVEYGWNFVTGGLGRFVANTSGAIGNYVDGVETPVERMPFVRRFVASDNSPSVQQDAYYKKREESQAKAQRLRAAVKSRAEGTDDGTADAVIERLAGELGARPSKSGRGISVPAEGTFKNSDSEIKALRLQETEIRNDKAITSAQRKLRIGELRAQMRQIMTQARANAAQQ